MLTGKRSTFESMVPKDFVASSSGSTTKRNTFESMVPKNFVAASTGSTVWPSSRKPGNVSSGRRSKFETMVPKDYVMNQPKGFMSNK